MVAGHGHSSGLEFEIYRIQLIINDIRVCKLDNCVSKRRVIQYFKLKG